MPVPLPAGTRTHPSLDDLLPPGTIERLLGQGDPNPEERDDRAASLSSVREALDLLRTTDAPAVLALLDRAVARWPYNAAGWAAKGWLYESLGRSGSALACYNRVLMDLQVEAPFVYEGKARSLASRGQQDAAAICRSRALALRADR